jgi:DNA-binding YbaB/EbfC family protein
MFNKLKQFKDLRTQAKTLQGALAGEVAEGEAEWGKIKVRMNGNQEVVAVDIAAELFVADKKDAVQKGVAEATNKAIKKVQSIMATKMKEMGGMDFGKLFKNE